MKNSGIKLWEEAKKVIPGGNQLLSKRSEMYLPNLWPTYYKKASGSEIWDLDNNHYYDFATMGIGACSLGYANKFIDTKVINAIHDGSMSTLNSYEEVALAKKLIEIHPWADMARFSRTGGEACSVAIRIARAYTGKSKVAFCGYHGWHDWYISANIGSISNLDEQLLPGLKPLGVPRELYKTSIPFGYNKLPELQKIVDLYGDDLAAIIMEPQRGEKPSNEFLEGVRRIATELGAVLIFDEVTSGFRLNIGGIHKVLGVNPDMAIFGKALGNGYPISAVIGKRDIMDAAQDSFISSTFWTERIGFVASLATIEYMEKYNTPDLLIKWGDKVRSIWEDCALKHGIKINVTGISPLSHITFKYHNSLAIQTLYTQLMLKQGFLLGASVYSTTAYTEEIIDKFAKATNKSFSIIAKAILENKVESLLEGEIKHNGFKRLVQ